MYIKDQILEVYSNNEVVLGICLNTAGTLTLVEYNGRHGYFDCFNGVWYEVRDEKKGTVILTRPLEMKKAV
jgi:hypothetical protein